MNWTEQAVDDLRRLWAEGHTGTAIGQALGCGKNAVIGKVHRLGLQMRKQSVAPTRRTPRNWPDKPLPPPRRRPAPPVVPVEPPRPLAEANPLVPVESRRIALVDLTASTCRFPIGDPRSRDFHFCGHLPKDGSPYCKWHHRVAYLTPEKRERRLALDAAA